MIWSRQDNYNSRFYYMYSGSLQGFSKYLVSFRTKTRTTSSGQNFLLQQLRLKGSNIKQCQLSVHCKVLLTSRSQKYGKLCSFDCRRVRWRVEIGQIFSFYFTQPKKYQSVGCFHVDFGAKILTISSFTSLKWALIWNNMLSVNVFGLCPLRNLICRIQG